MRPSAGGFSLVELLVVVSIIGLLVGLATLGVGKGLEAGDKAKAKAEMMAIVAAVKAYKQEYGFYPLPPSKRFAVTVRDENWGGWIGSELGKPDTPTDDCKSVMQILSGQNIVDKDTGTPMNPKQIRFLEGPQSDGTFLDPWGSAYTVKMD
ncbi:MAG: prepilin-type N-terminal cleavage/methylation domain-containing protein, partial [Verrucomicrobia bacterium]|nr:prepilin-type N-terminal cleavage/methylation domain-containing protein [Verrucomicrobiota bacterium]